MSSLALMRWLESAPDRYDAGMRAITLGRSDRVHDAVAEAAVPSAGARVLEIGCGTGAVSARLLARGARLTALDHDPEMLQRARERLAGTAGEVTWLERTAAEIDALPAAHFDAVVASLALSEMSRSERRFVLREAARRLIPGGRLVAADEVRPTRTWQRLVFGLLRWPQALLGWLLAGVVSHPIADLAAELADTGLRVRGQQRWLLGSLAVVVAEAAGGGLEA
jgi:demethylmenaquinone methyltransferase/2-methoxy-6-polyprenyl-1,4-benzoquinol methylase